jgi:anti-sigma B factor antagonist
MELVRTDRPGTTLIQIVGKLTATRLNESLRGLVKDILASGIYQIVIDMDKVEHMDSTGVGELVSAYTAVTKEKGALFLYNVNDNVSELLQTTNLLDIFNIVKSDSPEVKPFLS